MVHPTRQPGQRPQAPQGALSLGRPRCAGRVQGPVSLPRRAPPVCPGLHPPVSLCLSISLPPPSSLHAPTPLSLVSLSPGHHGSCLLSMPPCWAFCSRGQSAPPVCEDHIPSPPSPRRSARRPHSPSLGPPLGDGPFPWVRRGFPRRAQGAWAGAGSGEKSTTRPPKPGRSPLGDWVPQTPKDEPPLKSSQGELCPGLGPRQAGLHSGEQAPRYLNLDLGCGALCGGGEGRGWKGDGIHSGGGVPGGGELGTPGADRLGHPIAGRQGWVGQVWGGGCHSLQLLSVPELPFERGGVSWGSRPWTSL